MTFNTLTPYTHTTLLQRLYNILTLPGPFNSAILGMGEYFIRKLDGTTVRGQAHSIYLIQVRFGILGRYMNLTAGNFIVIDHYFTLALRIRSDIFFGHVKV